MTNNVPARQYPQFIEAFERKVTEYQKDIARMNAHQDIYTICKDCVDSLKLEESITVTLSPYGVSLTLFALPNTQEHTVLALTREIGKKLLSYKLHSDGEPSCGNNGADFQFIWSLVDPSAERGSTRRRIITLTVDVPWNGTNYIDVEKETKHTTYIQATPKWRTTSKEAPANSLGFRYNAFLNDEILY